MSFVSWLRDRVGGVVDRLGLSRRTMERVRVLAMVGSVIGFVAFVSALLFPRFPAWSLGLVFGEYADLLELLVVDERTFSIITGFGLFMVSATTHLCIDAYLGALDDLDRYTAESNLRLVVLVSFIAALVTARTAVVLSGIVGPSAGGAAGFIPVSEVWISGYHIHHFFFGFAALALVGWLVLFHPAYSRLRVAVLYGVGLGIWVDEFGMLLTEGDYFAGSTYFVAIMLVSLFLAGYYWDTRRESVRERIRLRRKDH